MTAGRGLEPPQPVTGRLPRAPTHLLLVVQDHRLMRSAAARRRVVVGATPKPQHHACAVTADGPRGDTWRTRRNLTIHLHLQHRKMSVNNVQRNNYIFELVG